MNRFGSVSCSYGSVRFLSGSIETDTFPVRFAVRGSVPRVYCILYLQDLISMLCACKTTLPFEHKLCWSTVGQTGKEGLKERSKKREEPEKSAVARPARRPGVAVGPPWSGARLEKLVRQTPGAMELRWRCGELLSWVPKFVIGHNET